MCTGGTKMLTDRRVHERVNDIYPMAYRVVSSNGHNGNGNGAHKTYYAKRLDLGGGGMLMVTDEMLPEKTWVKLEVGLKYDDELHIVNVLGEVVWTKEYRSNGTKHYISGVMYIKIHADDREKILRYVCAKAARVKEKMSVKAG